MKKLLFAIAISILLIPISRPLQGQEGGFGGGGGDSVDLSGLLGDRGGRGGFGGPGNAGRGGYQLPDSKVIFSEIQSALKKGKTPLDKSQEKPLQSMLALEVVTLSDRIQVLRTSNTNGGGNNAAGGFQGGRPDFAGGFPPEGGFQGGGRPDFAGGFPGGGNFPGATEQAGGVNAIANSLAVQTETLTSLKNDDFLANKIPAFLSPEQVALIQKTKASDKENATCLGGILDRVSNGLQNNAGRGNNNNGNNRGNFFNNNNNSRKSNGQAYCMTAEATATERLEPIRKVLAAGNLPLAKDKETIAEAFLKAQIKDLEDSLRSTLTANFAGNRGGGGLNNRSNNPQMIIQSTTDNMYKKAGAMLNPPQTETLKKWHYQQIMDRGGVETLIAIEAMQDTPLSDDQIARVTAAWPELRNQFQSAAKAAKKNLSEKDLDNSTMAKVLEMLEPAQVASFQDARKFVPAK
jgi:hypothetical protein